MEIYKQYSEVQKQIDELEAKKKLIRADIEKSLPAEGVKNEYVTAIWKSNKKWAYSPVIATLEAKLKEDKAKVEAQKEVEEKEGVATFEETKSLVVTAK